MMTNVCRIGNGQISLFSFGGCVRPEPEWSGKQAFHGKPCSEKHKKKNISRRKLLYDGLSLQIRQLSSWKVKEVALGKRPAFFGKKKGIFFHCKLLPLVFLVCLFCLCLICHAKFALWKYSCISSFKRVFCEHSISFYIHKMSWEANQADFHFNMRWNRTRKRTWFYGTSLQKKTLPFRKGSSVFVIACLIFSENDL